MPETEPMSARGALGALRRQWWVVAATFIVALAVAGVLVKDSRTTYLAEAEVTVRTAVATRETVLLPEQAVALARQDDFAQEVSESTGVSVDDYLANADSYATGSSQQHVHLEYTSTDRQEAEKVAAAMADAIIAAAQSTASSKVARAEQQIALTEDMIEITEQLDPLSVAISTDAGEYEIERRLYSLRLSLVSYEDTIDTLMSTYVRTGDVEVTASTAAGKVARPLVGAALAGLVLGATLAWMRDSSAAGGAKVARQDR